MLQVGDLTDNGNDEDIAELAAAANRFYRPGIGFFPMLVITRPTASGQPLRYSAVPGELPADPDGHVHQGQREEYHLGNNFNSPTLVSMDLAGMSYSFDYNDHGDKAARFVILDTWATPQQKSITIRTVTPMVIPLTISSRGSAVVLTRRPAGTEHALSLRPAAYRREQPGHHVQPTRMRTQPGRTPSLRACRIMT